MLLYTKSSDIDVLMYAVCTSSDSLLTKGAETLCILLPTAVLPVNEMTGTEECFTRASPALGPVPLTMLHTPGGRPGVEGRARKRERGEGRARKRERGERRGGRQTY